MPLTEKDRLASAVQERRMDFNMALSDNRRYPIAQFRVFWEAGRRYAEMTTRDPLLHRVFVESVYCLTDYLMVERRRVPEVVVRDAQHLENTIFSGYDSYFEGHEPPGL